MLLRFKLFLLNISTFWKGGAKSEATVSPFSRSNEKGAKSEATSLFKLVYIPSVCHHKCAYHPTSPFPYNNRRSPLFVRGPLQRV